MEVVTLSMENVATQMETAVKVNLTGQEKEVPHRLLLQGLPVMLADQV